MELLEKIEQLKRELDSLLLISKDQEAAIMQKFRLDWDYHSNHLEGNSLSFGETKALILFGITANGKPLQDHFEMTGHDEAVKWVEEVVKQDRPLTENFIRELHTLILKESYWVKAITPDGKPTRKKINVGQYKTQPNHVKTKTGEVFRFSTPEETPAKMKDLVEWYQKKMKEGELHVLLLAVEFHHRFVRIHPFDDGNGRTARILMNFILMQQGFPPVIIKTEDKENYFAALQQADAGMLKAFVQYIGKSLVHSLELMIKGAKGESIEEPEDLDKEIALIEQKLRGLDKKTKVTKSLEVILERYDQSFAKLFEAFIQSQSKLEKLYMESKVGIFFTDGVNFFTKEEAVAENRKILASKDEKLEGLGITYAFTGIKSEALMKASYYSTIEILFKENSYLANSRKGAIQFEKGYYEDLTDEEINTLVQAEAKRHTQFIKEQIDTYKKRK